MGTWTKRTWTKEHGQKNMDKRTWTKEHGKKGNMWFENGE
jgi:hypothetical protein